MLNRTINEALDKAPVLQKSGLGLARAIHRAVLNGGEQTRQIADLLHGIWLGHPLHPLLTDVAIGAWTMGYLYDLVSLVQRSDAARNTADSLVNLGNLAALPTALSGLADFSTIPRPAAAAGISHATLNVAALTLNLASAAARKNGTRGRAMLLSTTATALLLASSYLGGHLVYDKNVGVNHTAENPGPDDWTPVLNADELQERRPLRVNADGNPVLLYRQNGRIMAIGAVCPHAGGPLEEGQFYDGRVQCPWHDSVFNLADGCVVHGPSAFAAPNYETRIRDGRIEVRIAA